jgi:hypothetical protein
LTTGSAPTAYGREFTALFAGLAVRSLGLSLASAALLIALLSVALG